MPGPGGLGALARQQLAAWQQLAAGWPLVQDGPCLRCARCQVNVIRTHDNRGLSYRYEQDQVLALTVAHLRACHEDLNPEPVMQGL